MPFPPPFPHPPPTFKYTQVRDQNQHQSKLLQGLLLYCNKNSKKIKGKFKEVENTINLKELAKGIYYLKVSGSYSSKVMKE